MLTGSNNVVTWILLTFTAVIACALAWVDLVIPGIVCTIAGVCLSLSPRIVKDWERGVLLRLGKFTRVLNPGISWVVPKATNCAESFDRRPRNVYFNRRVDKLIWMIYSNASNGHEIKRFRPDMLPARRPERLKTEAKRLRGWQLVPFWQ